MTSPLDRCAVAAAAALSGGSAGASCRASVLGYLVASPLLLLVGTAGNLWTAAIVTRFSLRRSAASVLILAHAATDTLALWTGLSRHFYLSLTGIDVRETSEISCKLQRFMLYVAMDASATILVAISVDRFVSVWMPHRKKDFNLERARLVVCALTASSVFFNLHVLWTRGEQVLTNQSQNSTVILACGYPRPEYAAFWANYQGWLAMAYFSVVPFGSMVVLNTLTAIRLRARYRERPGSRDRQRLTAMLLISSMFFICVTAPAFLYNTIKAMGDHSGLEVAKRYQLQVADTYTTLLQYLNHAASFYLYVLTGKGFRRDTLASLHFAAASLRRSSMSDFTVGCEQREHSGEAVKASAVRLESVGNVSCTTSEAALSLDTG